MEKNYQIMSALDEAAEEAKKGKLTSCVRLLIVSMRQMAERVSALDDNKRP